MSDIDEKEGARIEEAEEPAATASTATAESREAASPPTEAGAEETLDERTKRCLRLFEEDPAGLPAFRSVEELLKQAGAWRTLLEVYRRRTDTIANRAERALIFGRMGHILEGHLANPEDAAAAYRCALEAHPGDADARRRLERILESAGQWEALAAALEEIEPRLHNAADRTSVQLRLAEIYQAPLERPDAAIAAYERALEAAPDSAETFDALRALLAREGRESRLADHLETRAGRVRDGAALLEEAAALFTGALAAEPGALDRAIGCHERILEIETGGEAAARSGAALVDLYRRGERWEPLVAALDRVQAAGDAAAAERALREKAEVLEQRLGDPSRALSAWRTLLERDPEDGEALEAAERLARATGDGEALCEILVLREQAGGFESDAEAIAACEERARILEELGGREEEAAAALEAVLALAPEHSSAIERLCRLYDRMGRPQDRARKLVRLAEAFPSGAPDSERGEAYREAGQALEEIGASEEAADAYRRARALLPRDRFVLARLQEIFAARGDVAEAREAAAAELSLLCGEALDRPGRDPARERILLERVAESATALSRADEAAACWEALLARDPAHRGALRALAVLYEKNGDDEGLLSVLVKASQLEEVPETRLVLLLRVGKLYETSCDDPQEAAACYEQALEIDPAGPVAFEGLQRLYPSLDRWAQLADLLARRAAGAPAAERARLLAERARILETRLSDAEGAAEALEEALALAPDDLDTLRALAALHRGAERWAALEALLEREGGLVEDASRRLDIAEARAELWDGPLGDPDRAADLWMEVLAASPDHALARERVRASHERAGRWEDAAALLEAELAGDPEPARAQALNLALAELWDGKLGRPGNALPYYRTIADARPDDGEARGRLCRALARSEAWDELVARLRDQADRDREVAPYGWGDALVEIARIHEDARDDPDGAEAILREVIAAVPEHAEAQERLFRRLEGRGDLEGLGDLIETSIACCEQADRKIALAREALRVALARETAERASGDRVIAACRRLIEFDGDDDGPLRVLEARLESRGSFKELLEVLSRRLSVAEGRDDRLEVALRLAALWEERFHRPDQALSLYRQARQIDPGSPPALRGMARLCEAEGRWEELLGVLDVLAGEGFEPRERAAAMRRTAEVLHARFGRDHDAMGQLERALALYPADEEARDLLESLAVTHRRHRTLARVIRARIDALPAPRERGEEGAADGERRAALCERLGDLLADDLKEPREAAASYQRARAASASRAVRRRIGAKLEAIHAALGDRDALEALYPELLEEAGEPAQEDARREAAGLWARYGDHLLAGPESASRDGAAAEAYGRACDLDPDGALRFEARRRLLDRMGAHRDLAEHAGRQAARATAGADAASLWDAAGRAWEAAGVGDEAEKAYRAALEADPDAPGAQAAGVALARLLERQGRREDLAALCEQRIPHAGEAAAERALHLEAAEILRDLPGGAGRSLAHCRRALALGDPEPALLRAVADLSLLAGDAAGAVEALERYLEVPPPREDLVFTLSTLARLWEESLGRAGRALEYCRMWIEADPGSGEALDRLERLLETRGAWRDLAELIESRASGRGPDATARLRKLARLYDERMRDARRAQDAWRRVLAVEPDAQDALNAVADGAPALGLWREGAAALDRLIAATPDLPRRRRLRERQADLLAPIASERPRAIEQLQALLEEGATPAQAAAVRPRLLALLEREGRFEESRRLLMETIAQAPPEETPALHAALGKVCETRLWRFEDALEAYRAWLAREPASVDCLHRLQALHRRLSRWPELTSVLRTERAAGADDERRLAITLELAAVEEEQLDSPAAAAAEYERALEIAPGHAGALPNLQRIYRTLGEDEALHRALGLELSQGPEAARAAALCLERARLEAGSLGRPDDSVASYGRAIENAPDAAPLLEELAALHLRLGRHADHLETLARLAESLSDARARGAVLARMGAACERAGETGRAIAFLEEAVSLHPALGDALAALRRLHEGEENFEGAAAALARLVACTAEPRRAAALAAELGDLCRVRLGNEGAAQQWYERAIGLDDGCREAHARLGEIRFANGDLASARAHLSRALSLEGDPRERRETAGLALKLGLSLARLGEPDPAIAALGKAVALDPGLTEAWRELGTLYLAAEEWTSARDALTRVANAEGAGAEARVAAQLGIARAEQALGRPETGLVALEGALASAPERYDLRLLRAELLTALERSGDAATAWREAALAAPDARRRAEALHRGATLLDTLPDQASRALGWFREALAADPDHTGALRRLADHALASESWREAGAYLESLTGLREDPRDQADLGRVWWEGFGEEQNALTCLRRAIELPGDAIEAVRLAVAICDERENWPRLAGFIEAYREGARPSADQLPILGRLAEVYAEKLYEPEAAARTLREMAALAPQDLDVRERLAEVLAGSAATYGDAAEIYRRVIDDAPLRASAWRGLAGLYWFQRRPAGCRDAATVLRLLGGEGAAVWESGADEARGGNAAGPWRDRFLAAGPLREALEIPDELAPLVETLQEAWGLFLPEAPADAPAADLGARRAPLDEAFSRWGLPLPPVLEAGDAASPLVVFGGEGVALGARRNAIERMAEPVWRFLCHRIAAQVALGLGPAGLGAPGLGAALAALGRAAGIDPGAPAPGEERFAPSARRLVHWRNRRRLRKALADLGPLDAPVLARQAAAHARAAERAALLAGADVAGALFAVASLDRGIPEMDPAQDSPRDVLETSRAARRLLRFMAGEAYLEAREAAASADPVAQGEEGGAAA